MNTRIVLILMTALLGISTVASADEAGMALAKKHGCMACHSIDAKIVGPAFKAVAQKYAGNPDARATLIETVKKGGKGNWGNVPMPGFGSKIGDEDVATLVDFVLATK